MGIIGFYTTMYFFSKLFSGKTKAVAETSSTSTSEASGMNAIPSVDSDEYGDWLSNNFEKVLDGHK